MVPIGALCASGIEMPLLLANFVRVFAKPLQNDVEAFLNRLFEGFCAPDCYLLCHAWLTASLAPRFPARPSDHVGMAPNRPELKSSIAWRISLCVFITKGP